MSGSNEYPCVNTILIDKHLDEQDEVEEKQEYVRGMIADDLFEISILMTMVKDKYSVFCDEQGISNDWIDWKEELELN